jgi:hypothetical protein
MIGLYIFGVLILAGFVTLVVVKLRWSRQAARNWATITARNNAIK